MKPKLSVIVACYNEEEHLAKSFPKLIRELEKLDIPFEVIIVEDCSTDTTRNIVKKLTILYRNVSIKTIFHNKNAGRGNSVMDGIKKARGEIVGFLDIDLEISPHYIAGALKALNNKEIIVASRRYKKTIAAKHRDIASRLYAFLVRFLFGLPKIDTEAGFKFFKLKKIKKILPYLKSDGWFWDTEIIIYSHRNKLSIGQIPVLFKRRTDKTSTVNILKDPIVYLYNMIRLKLSLFRI